MFIDSARCLLKAGDGGNGAVSFHREKYVPSGGPDGGDGGDGGSVIVTADGGMSTLADFRYKRKYAAENGRAGGANRCHGKTAPDIVLRVPPGTVIKDAESGRIIADIGDDDSAVIAKGGSGGWGNMHFATPTRQIPRFSKPGLPGETRDVVLELKLLADVGLVGLPNAGKSSLISVCSSAKPKIADYPFTTLTPVLGVAAVGEESFVIADIPGLIEGAGAGKGLGHEFLKHVERCRLLIHLVDVTAEDPAADFEMICRELAEYSGEIAALPRIVCANKCDIADGDTVTAFAEYIKAGKTDSGLPFFEISAATKQGTKELMQKACELLKTLPPRRRFEVQPELIPETKAAFSLTNPDDGVFIIESDRLVSILRHANMDDYESLQYFQRVLRADGVNDALAAAGVKQGDTVVVGDFEFEYHD